MKSSLQRRLMVTTTLVLGAVLGVTGWVLDRSFAASVVAGAEEQMRLTVYGLLASAEEHEDHLDFADDLGDPRLSQPESGLYAFVQRDDGALAWQSPSLLASAVSLEMPDGRPRPGEFGFVDAGPGSRFYLGYTVIWEAVEEAEFTFWVQADQLPFRAEIAEFRRSVTIGLVSVAFVFIGVQLLALRWGLRPVRTMADRVDMLEAGERADIGADYPSELSGLARNLNRFIEHEKENRERYRRAMDDLAHSLKTPLAVLRNAVAGLESNGGPTRPADGALSDLFEDQLDRMETTVTHQLSRATAVRPVIPGEAVPLTPLIGRLVRALDKAYADKAVAVDVVESEVAVRADERDLLEMLGNLLENAYKYTRSRIRVAVEANDAVAVIVDDDGQGIAEDVRAEVLRRGARADTATTGQGIGLAVVVEMVAAYEGRLAISDSDLGGARIRLELPR